MNTAQNFKDQCFCEDGFTCGPCVAAEAIERRDTEIERQRATLDAAIRILSDDRLPLQSRINDARSILVR